MPDQIILDRLSAALEIAQQGAKLGHEYFRKLEQLEIESKGQQDFVSAADREVELLIRNQLQRRFPEDGIVGEEFDDVLSQNNFHWVIDPIDGTTNFVSGIPNWCVVLAVSRNNETVIAVIVDPCAGEVWQAVKGEGALLNNKPLSVSRSVSLGVGSVGVGYCNRYSPALIVNFIDELLSQHNGVFFRSASGALMLAYVAAGRLIGYVEPHMKPWDCMAGLLLIEEAGGQVLAVDGESMLAQGGRIIAGCPGVYRQLEQLATRAFVEAAE